MFKHNWLVFDLECTLCCKVEGYILTCIFKILGLSHFERYSVPYIYGGLSNLKIGAQIYRLSGKGKNCGGKAKVGGRFSSRKVPVLTNRFFGQEG